MQITLGNCSPFSKIGREDLLHGEYDFADEKLQDSVGLQMLPGFALNEP